MDDLPFIVGKAPEQYELNTKRVRPGITYDQSGVIVTHCERIGEAVGVAPRPRHLPEPLDFKKGRLAWFPGEQDGKQAPESGYMKEVSDDNTVTMKDGKDVPLSDCWRTKKECEQYMLKNQLTLTEGDLSFAEDASISL